jgi:hypothetical protein
VRKNDRAEEEGRNTSKAKKRAQTHLVEVVAELRSPETENLTVDPTALLMLRLLLANLLSLTLSGRRLLRRFLVFLLGVAVSSGSVIRLLSLLLGDSGDSGSSGGIVAGLLLLGTVGGGGLVLLLLRVGGGSGRFLLLLGGRDGRRIVDLLGVSGGAGLPDDEEADGLVLLLLRSEVGVLDGRVGFDGADSLDEVL